MDMEISNEHEIEQDIPELKSDDCFSLLFSFSFTAMNIENLD
jgi:hypothetical protein